MDEEVPPAEYTIHGKGMEGNLITGMAEGAHATQLPPFNFDEGSEVQMVLVHLRVIYDLLSKKNSSLL